MYFHNYQLFCLIPTGKIKFWAFPCRHVCKDHITYGIYNNVLLQLIEGLVDRGIRGYMFVRVLQYYRLAAQVLYNTLLALNTANDDNNYYHITYTRNERT